MKKTLLLGLAVSAAGLTSSLPASAANLSLVVVDSFDRPANAPFGLAYDGTNIWWSNSSGQIYQMTTSGVDTGASIQGPYWSALAFDASMSKLVTMQSGSTTAFNTTAGSNISYTSLNPVVTPIAGGYGGLIDGLDVQSGILWWSPDVDKVFYSPKDGTGARVEFLGGAGGYSGVEYLTAGSSNYVVVVNDAFSPRQLCVHDTGGGEVGCTSLPNSRYEDLAFDGRYLYAADYYGNRIDKIDLLVDGGSILVPGQTPVPGAVWLMGSVLAGGAGFGAVRRRRKTNAA